MFSKITSVCLIGLLSLVSCSQKVRVRVPSAPPSIQQKVTHMLTLLSVDASGTESLDRVCTAVAVGPHVILTARHCYSEVDKRVSLDLSLSKYDILAWTEDNQDHIMIGLSGPEFHDYIDLSQNAREAVPSEKVYLYGCGGREYPPRILLGQQIPGFDAASEIDQAAHIQKFSMHVIPGDSGAAIFGEDEKIVALVTYGHDKSAVGFSLNFTPNQILVALTQGKGQTL